LTARRPLPWLKPAVFVGALSPLLYLALRLVLGKLGANFIEEALNQLGLVALVFLVASLCCTPLKTFVGWTWPMRLRRMLGLFAFFYASLHLSTYVFIDQQLDWATLVEDVFKRKFILVGMLSFLLMVPLAVTSTSASVRRLGFQRWTRLHRLVYLSAIFACVHFLWRVKADLTEPLLYAGALGLLFVLRLWTYGRKRLQRPS